ncbi:MAG: sigma-70 family RNA polymerase sigma factor [Ardenticatenales bacterium]
MTLAVRHRPLYLAAQDSGPAPRRADRDVPAPSTALLHGAVVGADAIADAALLVRVAAGEVAAHALLYERHAATLLLYLRRLVGDPEVAEELLHDVFLDVWRGAATYRAQSRVGTWLLAIAHSRACNELRRRSIRTPAALAARLLARGRSAAAPVDPRARADARVDVAAAVTLLSTEQAAVIELVYWHGLSLDEVASVVGAPIGTVKSRLSRARSFLRTALDGSEVLRGSEMSDGSEVLRGSEEMDGPEEMDDDDART